VKRSYRQTFDKGSRSGSWFFWPCWSFWLPRRQRTASAPLNQSSSTPVAARPAIATSRFTSMTPSSPSEVVETIRGSGLHLLFRDDTDLRLGSASTITLDKFVCNPDTKAGELVATVCRSTRTLWAPTTRVWTTWISTIHPVLAATATDRPNYPNAIGFAVARERLGRRRPGWCAAYRGVPPLETAWRGAWFADYPRSQDRQPAIRGRRQTAVG
jgi:hypothetical protein